jgi:hypothetical protein
MLNRHSLFSVAIIGVAGLLAACNSEQSPAKKVDPTSFATPPVWVDRVSQVAYNPSIPDGTPALGNYENEPARFYFPGVPLMPNEDEQAAQEPAALPSDIISSRSFSGPGGG